MAVCLQRFTRKKLIDISNVGQTKLARVLTAIDLTLLGIGSTLGVGTYVVAGQVAKEVAGPAVVISFLIAALASVLAGLCYAEFGARVPKTGSAYVYSYVTVGELWAFIIGWNLILEYVIGTASVARGWSSYFDSLIGGSIKEYFMAHVRMHVPSLSEYPDFFALGITLLLTLVLTSGVKESTRMNNLFTVINLLVVMYVILCGLFKVDINNWRIPKDEIPVVLKNGTNGTTVNANGDGGFFPFGFSGMMSGAATCFYAFVGFDCIATTGEEAKNPQKAIPIAIIVSLTMCFIAYFGIAAVLTLLVPYYQLTTTAPVSDVFDAIGWSVAKYVVAIGAVCGLSTSLLGAMFPMPRIVYAMASDGLLFRGLSRVNSRLKTPVIATLLSGLFAGVMAMLFDLKELVDMMSIGTLLAYTLVAACVLILRYKKHPFKTQEDSEGSARWDMIGGDSSANSHSPKEVFGMMLKPIYDEPTPITEKIVVYTLLIFSLCVILVCAFLRFLGTYLYQAEAWAIFLVAFFAAVGIVCVFIIWRQPEGDKLVTFKVPFVPFLPAISIFVNVYLMTQLSGLTWARFGIWMAIGFLIYFGYGIWHSSEEAGQRPKEEEHLTSGVDNHDESIQSNERQGLLGGSS